MKHQTAVIFAGITFGLIGPLIKLIGNNIPIMTVNFYRMLFGLIFLFLIIAVIDRKHMRYNKKEVKSHIIAGAFAAASFSLFGLAMILTKVSTVVITASTYAVFTAIFALFFLKEKLTKHQKAAIPAAILGIVILNQLSLTFDPGMLAAVLQAIVFAGFLVYMRYMEKTQTLASVFWLFLFGTIFLAPFPFIYGFGNFANVWIYVVLLGMLASGLPYLLLARGLEKLTADTGAVIIITTMPISAIIFAFLLVGEAITFYTLIGGAMVLTAGILAMIKCKQRICICH